jgi:hypothetical protein
MKRKLKYGKELSPRGLECECTQEEHSTSITLPGVSTKGLEGQDQVTKRRLACLAARVFSYRVRSSCLAQSSGPIG